MNKVILLGRLTREPEIRYSAGDNQTAIARYTLAVERRFKRQGDEQTADFINCVVYGSGAEFAENYLHQGTKILVCGRIQTGSYTNREGRKVYTTDVVVEEQEFAESKGSGSSNQEQSSEPSGKSNPSNAGKASAGGRKSSKTKPQPAGEDGFMQPGNEEDVPFNFR